PTGQAPDRIVWAGVTNQYFATILVPTDTTGERVWARRLQVPATDSLPALRGIYGALLLPRFDLAPGQSKTFDFDIYAGPKEYSRLAKISNDQTEVMGFTPWTKWISVLLLTVLNTLHSWVHSYALAIIIMTILIRALLWPLQNSATKSMRRMAKLSPIVNELREKYKDDPQRMNQEMMKLYKEYGINPVGGCLPMLIQIPIFFGFYGMLDKAIELRNSSFLWVRDLSQPDTVFHLGSIPINILPLVMAGTQVWQMSITPKTGDPAQQRLFLFMPIIFLLICYNYASALSLYWTVQNLFIIVQIYLTRNQMDAPLKKVRPTPVVAKKKSYR
ncbi:MAG: YidC/Oxa1 family insertase periplasmic-domain containing protein, partial [Verrucomicrobia bacterium]|nr:YidC/Oxa1 family insertase periplasmic-domain containing protein [Verrucomicrobiota bacterium]